MHGQKNINALNPELNPICCLLALLAENFLHVSRIRVKSLNLRLIMSYIYGAHILVFFFNLAFHSIINVGSRVIYDL
jgi:hypothetical protein